MIKATNKMISLAEPEREALRNMAFQTRITQSRLIQTMIKIVNASDINLQMLRIAANLSEEDLRHLRIMSDEEKLKKAPRQEISNSAKTDRGFTNSSGKHYTLKEAIELAHTRWID